MSKKEYVLGFVTYGAAPNLMVALCLKKRPAWQAGRWNGVGGLVADDETVAQAMTREFNKGTGVSTRQNEWEEKVSIEFPNTGPVVHVLHAHRESWVELPGDRAEEPVRWCRVDSLPPYVLDDVRWLLPLCLDDRIRFPVRVFMLPATVAGEGGGG